MYDGGVGDAEGDRLRGSSVEDGCDRLELMRVGFVRSEVTSAAVLARLQACYLGVKTIEAVLQVVRSAGRTNEFGVGLASLSKRTLATSEQFRLHVGFGLVIYRRRPPHHK